MTDTYIENKAIKRFLDIQDEFDEYCDNEGKVIKEILDTEGNITGYENVQLPNMSLTYPRDDVWFQVSYIPGLPMQADLGTNGDNRWIGVFQVLVCAPKNTGTYDVNYCIDVISKYFKRGVIFDGIRVMDITGRSSALQYDNYYAVPVSVTLWADLEN